jgi:serine/threonine-protein kinase
MLLRDKGSLAFSEAVDWILQACTGMAEAHAGGVVHRDLKPSNLFMSTQPNAPGVVKVMDFGISKMVLEGDELTQTETTLGTPQYMAPEQVLSSKSIDHRADIWSMGVVLYKAITGQYPFRGDGPAQMAVAIATTAPRHVGEVDARIPKGLAAAIMRALARHPSDRFQDMAGFAQAIAPYGSGIVPVTTNALVSVARGTSSPSLDGLRSYDETEDATGIEGGSTSSPWTQNTDKIIGRPRRRVNLPLALSAAFLALGLASFAGFKLAQQSAAKSVATSQEVQSADASAPAPAAATSSSSAVAEVLAPVDAGAPVPLAKPKSLVQIPVPKAPAPSSRPHPTTKATATEAPSRYKDTPLIIKD